MNWLTTNRLIPHAPTDETLPVGFRVRLAPDVIRADGGRSLFGGSSGRLLYLRPAAQQLLAAGAFEVRDRSSAVLARLLLDRGLAVPALPAVRPSDGSAPVVGVPGAGDVTVVVPVKDRPHSLAALLAALGPGLPVVVVDDGSADRRTADVARAAGAEVVRHETSRGPAAARNSGLARVPTPLVAFVDSDVRPVPGWLGLLLPHFADPALALVAPRVVAAAPAPRTPADRLHRWIAEYERARSSLDLGPVPALVVPRGRVAYLPSATVVARTAALGAGFDEQMQVGEDVDLVWRLVAAGWRVRYEPAAQVAHEHRTAAVDWLRRKAFYGTSAAPLAVRHPGAVAPMVSAPWSAVAWAALLAQRPWSLPTALGVSALATARLAAGLQHSDRPGRTAVRLAPWALTGTGWQLAVGLTRHWWPVTLLACLLSRRARRVALAAAVLEGIADWRRVRPRLGPVRYAVAHLLDNVAYGGGLWLGAWRSRTVSPLLPALSGRPLTPGTGVSRQAARERLE